MTLEQLEGRVTQLEKEIAEIRKEFKRPRKYKSAEDTFGAFANDPFFDEMVRLGREWRERVNAEENF